MRIFLTTIKPNCMKKIVSLLFIATFIIGKTLTGNIPSSMGNVINLSSLNLVQNNLKKVQQSKFDNVTVLI